MTICHYQLKRSKRIEMPELPGIRKFYGKDAVERGPSDRGAFIVAMLLAIDVGFFEVIYYKMLW
ncbi:hypothetical protein IYY11_02290 [Methylocystis sp. H62]|uniref:hypothetical protein n=1 Tax=Methylocystis sp. H62 TaxID=2785789 RepID=UPI0018C223B5|nr:hypothetical protein [Methylocystis sp. H62]MBG0792297.1 hypothetical protein [Methylocystis sp. H62]